MMNDRDFLSSLEAPVGFVTTEHIHAEASDVFSHVCVQQIAQCANEQVPYLMVILLDEVVTHLL
ncbi:hypothetical protein D3C75_1340650 [compost metagenome]